MTWSSSSRPRPPRRRRPRHRRPTPTPTPRRDRASPRRRPRPGRPPPRVPPRPRRHVRQRPQPPTATVTTLATVRTISVGTHDVVATGVVTAVSGRLGTERLLAIGDGTGGLVVRLPAGISGFGQGTTLRLTGTLAAPYGQLEIRPASSGIASIGTGALPTAIAGPGRWSLGSHRGTPRHDDGTARRQAEEGSRRRYHDRPRTRWRGAGQSLGRRLKRTQDDLLHGRDHLPRRRHRRATRDTQRRFGRLPVVAPWRQRPHGRPRPDAEAESQSRPRIDGTVTVAHAGHDDRCRPPDHGPVGDHRGHRDRAGNASRCDRQADRRPGRVGRDRGRVANGSIRRRRSVPASAPRGGSASRTAHRD